MIPEQTVLESEEWKRTFRRIWIAARDNKLTTGPVIVAMDFARYPEALADVFELACGVMSLTESEEDLDRMIDRLEDAASDIEGAASTIRAALNAAREPLAKAIPRRRR